MVTPQWTYQDAQPFRAVEDLVKRLDQQRSTTGSFVCRGPDEAEIVGLTIKALKNRDIRSFLDIVMEGFETLPGEDKIFRSSLTVPDEPKSMDSVFVPRDQQREGIFLPYLLYSLGKLYMNFSKPEVKAELIAAGHALASVRLAILVQVVSGARDDTGAVGRERTASFSASVYTGKKRCQCNIVFGLPLLATRPWFNGTFQAPTVTVERFSLQSPFPLDATNTTFDWRKEGPETLHRADLHRAKDVPQFRQTHKATLIPERGIVYEQLRPGTADPLECFNVGGKEVCLPVPPLTLQKLLPGLATVSEHMQGGDPLRSAWRIDGVITQSPDTASWGEPSFVGVSQILE
jgi:hypothetical protein